MPGDPPLTLAEEHALLLEQVEHSGATLAQAGACVGRKQSLQVHARYFTSEIVVETNQISI